MRMSSVDLKSSCFLAFIQLGVRSRLILVACFLLMAPLLARPGELFATPAEPDPEAEQWFRQQPRWLGADGVHSTQLDDERRLWTFADSFVAMPGGQSRRGARMISNTIAIQAGGGTSHVPVTFFWRESGDGSPASFFPDRETTWFWPQASLRLTNGPLISFLFRIERTPGEGLGHSTQGYTVAVIDNPEDEPMAWKMQLKDGLPVAGFVPGSVLVRQGDFVVALAVTQGETLAGALVRYPSTDLASGDLSSAQWWTAEGWKKDTELGPGGPARVLDHAGSESSIHWDVTSRRWLHVTSYGFGAAFIGLRTAPDLTGPWGEVVEVYRPPESDFNRPFVYGAVAHAGLSGRHPGELLVTYSANSFEFSDLLSEWGHENLYWPRVVAVKISSNTDTETIHP